MITALIDLLGACYQAGNPDQMEAIARSMLAAIPDDLVALQFLGLALYQMGREDDARQVFGDVEDKPPQAEGRYPTTGELAVVTSYREALRPAAGLAEAWRRIAAVAARYGFRRTARRAYEAARASAGQDLAARLRCR